MRSWFSFHVSPDHILKFNKKFYDEDCFHQLSNLKMFNLGGIDTNVSIRGLFFLHDLNIMVTAGWGVPKDPCGFAVVKCPKIDVTLFHNILLKGSEESELIKSDVRKYIWKTLLIDLPCILDDGSSSQISFYIHLIEYIFVKYSVSGGKGTKE